MKIIYIVTYDYCPHKAFMIKSDAENYLKDKDKDKQLYSLFELTLE